MLGIHNMGHFLDVCSTVGIPYTCQPLRLQLHCLPFYLPSSVLTTSYFALTLLPPSLPFMSTHSLLCYVKWCTRQIYISKGSLYIQIFYIFMNTDLYTPASYINRLNIRDDTGTRNGCTEVVRTLSSNTERTA